MLPETVAEAFLFQLRQAGVDFFFANPGTDFAPIIEAYTNPNRKKSDFPEPLAITHETVAVGMSHGYTLATRKPQAVMLHTNVGLANGIMALLNASSDRIPMLLISGRTPITEGERLGHRDAGIHWGQEMRDQAGMIREIVKWDYDARFGDQIPNLIDRAMAIANSAPGGPVYLSLAREVLGERWPKTSPLSPSKIASTKKSLPEKSAIDEVANLLANAKSPLIILQRSGNDQKCWDNLKQLSNLYAIPVGENWSIRAGFPTFDPMHIGFSTVEHVKKADVILAVDSMVPWLPAKVNLMENCKVIQISEDPLFSKIPVRGYPSDFSLVGDVGLTIECLCDALANITSINLSQIEDRRKKLTINNIRRREKLVELAKNGASSPMSPLFVSWCINQVFGPEAIYVNELALNPAVMNIDRPSQYFSHPMSAGLGWGVPTGLGIQLADRKQCVIACVGDGSHLFSNPVACHQAAEALNLPLLTCVFNNGVWNAVRRATTNMYPTGNAVSSNMMPLTSLNPLPDFSKIIEASRGFGQRITDGEELVGALERAKSAIRSGQHALLDIVVGIS